jgi:hypothetical protein
MNMRIALPALLLTAVFNLQPAGAQARPPGQKLDPVGTYDLSFEGHGQTQPAVITVTKMDDGRLGGTLEVHGEAMHFSAVKIEDRKLTLVVTRGHDGGELSITLTFKTDDRVEGNYTSGMGNGALAGTRRKAGRDA